MSKKSAQPRNHILRCLTHEEYTRLLPFSQRVTLPTGDILFEPGDRIAEFYFLDSGMASLLSTTESGSTIEAGTVGDEGFVRSALVLKPNRIQHRSIMQSAGPAT